MKSGTKFLIISVLFASILIHVGHGARTSEPPKLFSLRPKYFKPTNLNAPVITGTEPQKNTKNTGRMGKRGPTGQKPVSSSSGGCGSTLIEMKEGEAGYIQSPNYPSSYTAGTECLWTLKTIPGNLIYLTIFDVRTFSDPFTEYADSIFISLIGEWNETQRFSGDLNAITPIHLVTQGTDLLIRFKASIFGGNQRGFRMGYHARKKPALLDPADKVIAVVCPSIPVDTPSKFPDKGHAKRTPQHCPFYQEEKEPSEVEAITRINPTPYLVGLVLDDTQFCAGSLIDPEHVITSAHCTTSVKKIELLFGATEFTNLDAGVQKRTESGTAVSTHPKFSPTSGLYDISIVKLSKPVQLTRFVKPVRLPSWDFIQDSLIALPAQVSGWGENDGNIADKSNTSDVQINPNEDCRTSLHKGLSGMMLCLRSEDMTGCSADAGSPITTRCAEPEQTDTDSDVSSNPKAERPCASTSNTLLGLMSFGSCERGYAFTRLTPHLDFIANATGLTLQDF